MFAILALPSTLASLDNEKDNIVPEKDNAPVEFANKIPRGLDRLVTKVKKDHHASIIQAESTVKVESAVEVSLEDSMLALHAESPPAKCQDFGGNKNYCSGWCNHELDRFEDKGETITTGWGCGISTFTDYTCCCTGCTAPCAPGAQHRAHHPHSLWIRQIQLFGCIEMRMASVETGAAARLVTATTSVAVPGATAVPGVLQKLSSMYVPGVCK